MLNISTALTWDIILFRIILSFAVAFLIGLEREKSRQIAGLRTHILICVGSALLMILSIYIPSTYVLGNGIADPGRIAAQVVSGIGFLGAGAILKYGFNVKGLTTAANIWVMAAIGLAIGGGLYFPAILVAGVILVTLILISKIERKLFKRGFMKSIEIEFEEKKTSFNQLKKIISKYGRINNVELSMKEKIVKTRFIVQLKKGTVDNLLKEIQNKIKTIKITENSNSVF